MKKSHIEEITTTREECLAKAREITDKYRESKSLPKEAQDEVDRLLLQEMELADELEKAKREDDLQKREDALKSYSRKSRPTHGQKRISQREAVQAWITHGCPDADETSYEMREACANYGINLNKNTIKLSLRDMGQASGAIGGYSVAEDTSLVSQLEVFLKANSGLLEVAQVYTTSTGAPMPFPRMDDTGNDGQQVDEGDDDTSPRDLGDTNSDGTSDLDEVTLYSWKYSPSLNGMPLSIELLNDAAFNWESHVWEASAQRIARTFNALITRTGSGTNEPEKIIAGTNIFQRPHGQTALLTSDNLTDLEHQIDPSYRRAAGNVGYMFSDKTLAAIKKIKDGNDRPLYVPLQPGVPGQVGSINGYPVFINTALDDLADNKLCIIFGNFTRGYVVRRVSEVTMIRDPYTLSHKGQVRFSMFVRMDGRIRNENAFAIYNSDEAS